MQMQLTLLTDGHSAAKYFSNSRNLEIEDEMSKCNSRSQHTALITS